MKTVRVCGPAGKAIRELIDAINGQAGAPKATTIGDTVFLWTDEEPSAQLIRHEAEHIRQAQRLEPAWMKWWPWAKTRAGWARFWLAYGAEHRKHGYWDNRFEREARIAAGEESA